MTKLTVWSPAHTGPRKSAPSLRGDGGRAQLQAAPAKMLWEPSLLEAGSGDSDFFKAGINPLAIKTRKGCLQAFDHFWWRLCSGRLDSSSAGLRLLPVDE